MNALLNRPKYYFECMTYNVLCVLCLVLLLSCRICPIPIKWSCTMRRYAQFVSWEFRMEQQPADRKKTFLISLPGNVSLRIKANGAQIGKGKGKTQHQYGMQ